MAATPPPSGNVTGGSPPDGGNSPSGGPSPKLTDYSTFTQVLVQWQQRTFATVTLGSSPGPVAHVPWILLFGAATGLLYIYSQYSEEGATLTAFAILLASVLNARRA